MYQLEYWYKLILQRFVEKCERNSIRDDKYEIELRSEPIIKLVFKYERGGRPFTDFRYIDFESNR